MLYKMVDILQGDIYKTVFAYNGGFFFWGWGKKGVGGTTKKRHLKINFSFFRRSVFFSLFFFGGGKRGLTLDF